MKAVSVQVAGSARTCDIVKRNWYTVWVRIFDTKKGPLIIKRHIRKHNARFA